MSRHATTSLLDLLSAFEIASPVSTYRFPLETSPLLALLMGGVRLAENSTPNVARRLCVGEEHLLEGQRPSGSPECVFLQLESLEPPALAQNVQPEEPWLWQHTRGLKQNGAFHRQQLAGSATRSVLHFVTGEWLSGVL